MSPRPSFLHLDDCRRNTVTEVLLGVLRCPSMALVLPDSGDLRKDSGRNRRFAPAPNQDVVGVAHGAVALTNERNDRS